MSRTTCIIIGRRWYAHSAHGRAGRIKHAGGTEGKNGLAAEYITNGRGFRLLRAYYYAIYVP